MTWQQAPTVTAAQRRTVGVLFGAQALGGLAMGAGSGMGSLVAYEVTGSESLAGISRIIAALSTAVLAVPLATLALRRGRRGALSIGWGMSVAGGLFLAFASKERSLLLLMLGMFVFGGGSAANLQSRFAATDMAPAERRARTMSLVMWAGTFGSIIGPNLAAPGRAFGAALGFPEIAGTYLLASIAALVGSSVVALFLRPDPMRVAQEHGEAPLAGKKGATLGALGAIWRDPTTRFALLVVVLNQMVMVAVMALTPVHMKNGGHPLEAVGVIISVHVAGMYALSPLVGWLVDRWGKTVNIGLCLAVNLAATACCFYAGENVVLIGLGLFLLGLGWSFGMIAGSALLLDAVDAEHRTASQGTMDTLINIGAALAAGLAGVVLATFGYRGLSVASACLLLPIGLGLLLVRRRVDSRP